MSVVQFSSRYITVQGGLLYWLVSLIHIGLETLIIENLLHVMFLALVQDLTLGPVRNNKLVAKEKYRATVNEIQEA